MVLFWKTAAGIIIAVILILTVEKQERDLSMMLSLITCVMAGLAAFTIWEPVLDFMYRIAERHALHISAQCLITGESLGQVASQTIEGITSSNSVVETLPVLRPLIAFDKNEIIDISVKMGTYETSILPYEDCCTVFLPEFPAIRPKMEEILREERKLDVEALIEEAFASIEKIEV